MKPLILEDLITGKKHFIYQFKTYTIGRAPGCNIETLNPEDLDPKYTERIRKIAAHVSGLHAEISYEKQGVFIWDKNSKNGTFIQYPTKEEPEPIPRRTHVPLNSTIYFSKSYAMVLHGPVDLESQHKKEVKAATDKTQEEIII